MNTSKWHFSNSTRIQDIKNTQQTQADKPQTRRQVHQDDWQPGQPQTVDQARQLRNALCEAIEENEFLRERVIELEALLAEAQGRIESIEEKYVCEMNALQRAYGSHRTPTLNRSRSL